MDAKSERQVKLVCALQQRDRRALEQLMGEEGLDEIYDLIVCALARYEHVVTYVKDRRYEGAAYHLVAERDGKVVERFALPVILGDTVYQRGPMGFHESLGFLAERYSPFGRKHEPLEFMLSSELYLRLVHLVEMTDARNAGQVLANSFHMTRRAATFWQRQGVTGSDLYLLVTRNGQVLKKDTLC